MLDRESELEVIRTAISTASTGSGSALIVEGVAGIGKTRLLAQGCALGARAGLRILRASCGEFEAAYPWGMVRQVFDCIVRDDSAVGPRRFLRDAGRLALPALGLGVAAGGGKDDEFALLHGLYWLTADMTRESALLIAVDDLHWSDRPSLRFAAHLIRRLEGLPVLLMMSARPPRPTGQREHGDPDHVLASIRAQGLTTVISPGPLSGPACASLLRGALGGQPAPAFAEACQQMTGGNPFLLQALADSLVAERVAGTAADAGHVRRMTPAAISRRVLLQLGQLPPGALAIARAITILGAGATTARACGLAELGVPEGARVIETLMSDRLVEGEQTLAFVHPLVRSAVYHDMAPPVRQGLHLGAARMLAAEGCPPQDVAVHLLECGHATDPWAVSMLRRAAGQAREQAAPDLALRCLERALAQTRDPEVRNEVLAELGSMEVGEAPERAVEHLTGVLSSVTGPARRAAVALPLGQALAVCGRFAESVEVLAGAVAELGDGDSGLRARLQAVLLDTARWDLASTARADALLAELDQQEQDGGELAPALQAILATYQASVLCDRRRALSHARRVLPAATRLFDLSAPIVPETISVLLFCDQLDEARQAVQEWLRLTQSRGLPIASSVAASFASFVALHAGAVSESAAWARQALDASGSLWVSPIAVAVLVQALIERGDSAAAHQELAAHGLAGDLGRTWPANRVRYARACLYAADGDHRRAADDLLTAGDLAERWRMRNPALMSWRSAAALSLAALGQRTDARELCAEELRLARHWGPGRALGIALRAAGITAGGQRGIEMLSEAADVLGRSPARLEHARALADLGSALRRSGARTEAREPLRQALDLAHANGGLALAERARSELIIAGGRPRRHAIRGRDALTPSELRVAQMAAEGRTNRQIAQALFVTQRTVETHLTSAYGKLGIRSRPELTAALATGGRAASVS